MEELRVGERGEVLQDAGQLVPVGDEHGGDVVLLQESVRQVAGPRGALVLDHGQGAHRERLVHAIALRVHAYGREHRVRLAEAGGVVGGALVGLLLGPVESYLKERYEPCLNTLAAGQ